MLLNLHIKNYALIDDLHLEFTQGLNIFTGETGAGKSIIIESLGLILGGRASAQMIKKGALRCFITAEFDCSDSSELKRYLDEAGFAAAENDSLILRREIDTRGKSRAFVNDCPATSTTLLNIGEYLVDVHGQHEHQTLIKSFHQRRLLDNFGGLESLRNSISEKHRIWKQLTAQKLSCEMSEQEKQRFIDLYSHQLKEIDDAKLLPGEEEEIERILPQLKNAEKLREMSSQAHHLLYSDEGAVLEKLKKSRRLLENISSLCGMLNETTENLKNAFYQIEECANETEDFHDSLKADPGKLNKLMDRQDLIYRLKKKYGQNINEIIEYREKISKELSAISSSEQNQQEVEKKIEKTQSELFSLCKKLTLSRKKAGEKLSAGIGKELSDLGMKKVRFEISIEKETEPASEGWDKIEFIFSANPGEDLKPIKSIASGGEMSRVMLAIKTVLAKADNVPVLIFDEIDVGIGGPMGQTVGKKLKNLSKHHQILCITHLPQITAFSSQHLSVGKDQKGKTTSVQVKTLSEKDHLEEIARMLSGKDITPTARKHAAELIRQSQ